jgi:hypothetical protein
VQFEGVDYRCPLCRHADAVIAQAEEQTPDHVAVE